MPYADEWRRAMLTRVTDHARHRAIETIYGALPDLVPITYAEALDSTLRAALDLGAHRLPDPVWWDLETYAAGVIAATIDTLEALRRV